MSDLNSVRVSANRMEVMELSSVIKFLPPFRRSIGMSNIAALCPAKTVQMSFVVCDEAAFALAFRKIKNRLSTSDKAEATTG